MVLKLKDLAVKHDYYFSESNYFSNEAYSEYETFKDFLDEYGDADIDMNLITRWDVEKADEDDEKSEDYCLKILMIKQRKGIYSPVRINRFEEADVAKFVELVTKHWEKIQSNWNPISKLKNESN